MKQDLLDQEAERILTIVKFDVAYYVSRNLTDNIPKALTAQKYLFYRVSELLKREGD